MERRDEDYVPIRELVVGGAEELLKQYGKSMKEGDKRWLEELYISAHKRKACLAENSLRGLEILRKMARHFGVISDADDKYLRRILNALGIAHFFDSVTSSEEAGVGKPNPEIFSIGKRKAGSADLFYYIGDSERRDIEGGRKAGMHTILISEEGRRSSADYVARDLYEAALWISERNEYVSGRKEP